MPYIYLLPIIAAFIGWLTNYLAIKMLFHPKKPVNLGLFKLQGIFPKRQQQFATKIGEVIVEELFSIEDILETMQRSDVEKEIKKIIESHVDDFVQNRFKEKFPMLSTFASDKLIQQFKEILMEELDDILPDIIETYAKRMEKELDIQEIIAEKVADFSSHKLEALLFSIMKNEFRFVEAVGAVLGFLIGMVQVIIVQVGA